MQNITAAITKIAMYLRSKAPLMTGHFNTGPPLMGNEPKGPQGQKEFFMKRLMTRKRHRPEEVVVKLREVDEAGRARNALEDVAKSLSVSLMSLHR